MFRGFTKGFSFTFIIVTLCSVLLVFLYHKSAGSMPDAEKHARYHPVTTTVVGTLSATGQHGSSSSVIAGVILSSAVAVGTLSHADENNTKPPVSTNPSSSTNTQPQAYQKGQALTLWHEFVREFFVWQDTVDWTNPSIRFLTVDGDGLYACSDALAGYFKITHPAIEKAKFVKVAYFPSNNNASYPKGRLILATESNGIYLSKDLGKSLEPITKGLPFKHLVADKKIIPNLYRDIIDFAYDPRDPNHLFAITSYMIFYTESDDYVWKPLSPGSLSSLTCIAYSSSPFALAVGTATQGCHIKGSLDGAFQNANTGFKSNTRVLEQVESLNLDTHSYNRLYCGQSFTGYGYQLALGQKGLAWKSLEIPVTKPSANALPDLYPTEAVRYIGTGIHQNQPILCAVTTQGIFYQPIPDAQEPNGSKEPAKGAKKEGAKKGDAAAKDKKVASTPPDLGASWKKWDLLKRIGSLHSPGCISGYYEINQGVMNQSITHLVDHFSNQDAMKQKSFLKQAKDRYGIYVQTDVVRNTKRLNQLIDLIKSTPINMITIDLKDDSGNLRYPSTLKLAAETKAVVVPLDLLAFTKKMHEHNVYVVARQVVFKDPKLWHYADGKYAIRDKTTGKAWFSHKSERWVDQYCEEVWKYNADVASELIQNGVDEIQFDYIRFPTDGGNLENMVWKHRLPEQEPADALESYLRLVRYQVDAPLSIDIYGRMGWYHLTDRLGQDIRMISHYVDTICPMFYPSHFENAFLNFEPFDQRPLRIYYYGARRSQILVEGRSLIRPYVQAFRLGVPFDKEYYNHKYIYFELLGNKIAQSLGYTFWNAGTNYADVKETYSLYKAIH